MLVSVFKEYQDILSKDLKGFNFRYINGRTQNRKHCAGYCDNSIHQGALSFSMMESHQCVEKECIFLYTFVDNDIF